MDAGQVKEQITMATRSRRRMRTYGIFQSAITTEGALRELETVGFSRQQISLIAKQPDKLAVEAPTPMEEATDVGAVAGGAVGGTLGLIAGLGTVSIVPGLGPIVAAGVAAITLITTAAGGVVGATAGALLGGLVGYGIPKEQAEIYRDRINQGQFFVMVEGTPAESKRAEAVFMHWNAQELKTYEVVDTTRQRRPAKSQSSPHASRAGIQEPLEARTVQRPIAPDTVSHPPMHAGDRDLSEIRLQRPLESDRPVEAPRIPRVKR